MARALIFIHSVSAKVWTAGLVSERESLWWFASLLVVNVDALARVYTSKVTQGRSEAVVPNAVPVLSIRAEPKHVKLEPVYHRRDNNQDDWNLSWPMNIFKTLTHAII